MRLLFYDGNNLRRQSTIEEDDIISISLERSQEDDLTSTIKISAPKHTSLLTSRFFQRLSSYAYFVNIELNDGILYPGISYGHNYNEDATIVEFKVVGLLKYSESIGLFPGLSTNRELWNREDNNTMKIIANSPHGILKNVIENYKRQMRKVRSPYSLDFIDISTFNTQGNQTLVYSYNFLGDNKLSNFFEDILFSDVVDFGLFRIENGFSSGENFSFKFKVDNFNNVNIKNKESIIQDISDSDKSSIALASHVYTKNPKFVKKENRDNSIIYTFREKAESGFKEIKSIKSTIFLGDINDTITIDGFTGRIKSWSYNSSINGEAQYIYEITNARNVNKKVNSIEKRVNFVNKVLEKDNTLGYMVENY